ncbi:uncharacterized protein LOC141830966 [Curcuma longa]|uniref:uncharacterized protein LOC141830966 n=1 Tax=Curcuma longa TaxID=136217 RepID=UPI003D9EB15C
MASTCVNASAPLTDSAFLDFAPSRSAFGWLSPRISFSHEDADPSVSDDNGEVSLELAPDFEFRPEDPVAMLPADELFSDGKLVPLQISAARAHVEEIRSPEAERPRRVADVLGSELCAQSPKAPRCSSRWRELLGLKKSNSPKPGIEKAVQATPTRSLHLSTKSLLHLLHRHQKPSLADSSISTPLLRDSEAEPVSVSTRRSLSSSSSSSGADHDEFPRLSLDFEKRVHDRISLARATTPVRASQTRGASLANNHATRTGRSPVRRRGEAAPPSRGVSVDSPRMNASGKVVFQALERSSSSPGSFPAAGVSGHHFRRKPYRAMERSYSANVRIAPVLNVIPVGSLRVSSKPGSVFGFGQFFSPHKKEKDVSAARWNPHSSGSRSHTIDKA